MEKSVWGIDPGSSICGVCELRNGLIGNCFNETPDKVYSRIMRLCGSHKAIVVIEGMAAYSNKFSNDTIDTCYLIGELRFRFNTNTDRVESVKLVTRSTVRSWIFKTVPDICIPRVIKRMEYIDLRIKEKWVKLVLENKADPAKPPRGLRDKDGKLYEPHFKYVDDRTVIAALKPMYDIPTPKPGKKNIFGLTGHNWQALACAAYFNTQ